MKKLLLLSLLFLLLPIFSFGQLQSDILEQKIILDTKVELSKSYLLVSVGAIAFGFLPVKENNQTTFLGLTITGIVSTPYHLVRHLLYVNKRNKFYKEHNLQREKRRDRKKKNRKAK
jgi:hypothetical protein